MHSRSNPTETSEPSYALTCHRLGTGLLLDRCIYLVSQELVAESLSAYFQRAGWGFHSVGNRRRDRTKATRCPATRPPAGTKATRCPATRPHAGTWHTLPPARPHPHVAAFCRDPVRPRHPPAHLPTHSTSSRSLLHPPSPARLDCSTTHHACVFASRRTFAITGPFGLPAPSGPPLGTVRST